MDLESLLLADPTLNQNRSVGLINALVANIYDWRLYTTVTHADTTSLIRRYLTQHARVPGVVGEWMLPWMPLQIFELADAEHQVWIKGALFSNGAVCRYQTLKQPVDMLWVAQDTATFWCYPGATSQEES